MNERILITGGLGYLGGRVAQYLAQNTSYYLGLGVRNSGVEPPKWLSNGELIKLDVMNDELLSRACKNVSVIIHFAAVNEIDSLDNPELALQINTLGTLKLLTCAVRAGVKRIIYFSTAHVYGNLTGVINEETVPRPIHPYAITHHAAEDFILAAHDSRNITGIVFRLSNGLGVPERSEVNRWTLIVNDLCKQAVTTGKFILRSSGLQRRDFVTIYDIGRAVEHIISLPEDKCGDGLLNLGGEAPLRIIDLVEIISSRCESVLGFRPKIIKPEHNGDESPLLEYQIKKLKKTGFCLSGSIEDEIDNTLILCRNVFS